MAGTITHDKISLDILNNLNKELPINKKLYRLSNQGHDLGMFFKWYNLKLRSATHNFTIDVLQDSKFINYIETYINYIKKNKLSDNIAIKNYLYGYITHHYLDANTHPFIIYKTEKYIGQQHYMKQK